MTDAVTLAHISDVHLGPLPPFPVRHWNVKRALGYLNWQRKRRHIHAPAVADLLASDIRALGPDHIAVTGDLVNIGLPEEYEQAAQWLARLGAAQAVSVVPGNHDIYVALPEGTGAALWRPHMASCDFGNGLGLPSSGFPFVRRIGGSVALIGLNSAHPTAPGVAGGRLGVRQRESLAHVLDEAGKRGLIRVVLIHHPPLVGQIHRRAALADAAEMEKLLAAHGADLVLHGHTHLDTLVRHRSRHGEVVVAGAASASAVSAYRGAPLARYNLYRIWREAGRTRIEARTRGLATPGGSIVDLKKTTIA